MPFPVDSFADCAKMVACGDQHTLILSVSGLIYACGKNDLGQLGLGSRDDANTLQLIEHLAKIPMMSIGAGSFSASISEESKSLFLRGTGSFGEFLVPHRVKRIQGEVL